jgi:hypothetical protein
MRYLPRVKSYTRERIERQLAWPGRAAAVEARSKGFGPLSPALSPLAGEREPAGIANERELNAFL